MCLPLDLSISIDKDDPMWSFLEAVEGAFGVIKQDFKSTRFSRKRNEKYENGISFGIFRI